MAAASALPARPLLAQAAGGQPTTATVATAPRAATAAAPPGVARRPCEGGAIVRVDGGRYLCKYARPAAAAAPVTSA